MDLKPTDVFIHDVEELRTHINMHQSLENCTLQDLDLTQEQYKWADIELSGANFLGCSLSIQDETLIRQKGGRVYNKYGKLPYNPYRKELYTWQELMEGWSKEEDNSLDYRIYQHFYKDRFKPDIHEALSQRIHDHAIDHAMRELLDFNGDGMTRRKCVGFMGGHSTLRTNVFYQKTAIAAKMLADQDYFVVSGGGPGIMEAANLGAWFRGRNLGSLLKALSALGKVPHYEDEGYFDAAMEVLDKYPNGGESLAIPTWFYGHEPSNLFASHIAKYFSNSIREDNLLAVSLHGVVFAPGSAGTTQEIFMDATQNHYGTFNYYSPMVFLGRKRYEIDTLIYPLLRQLSYGKEYSGQLFLTDEPGEVVRFIVGHPPKRVRRKN